MPVFVYMFIFWLDLPYMRESCGLCVSEPGSLNTWVVFMHTKYESHQGFWQVRRKVLGGQGPDRELPSISAAAGRSWSLSSGLMLRSSWPGTSTKLPFAAIWTCNLGLWGSLVEPWLQEEIMTLAWQGCCEDSNLAAYPALSTGAKCLTSVGIVVIRTVFPENISYFLVDGFK
jgi:hypothetical protein